jgi:hypothetical protein
MDTLLTGIEAKYPDSKELIKTIRSNHDYVFNANDLDSQYKFFKANNSHEIETDFHKENDFKTSMRGIKIRGVFDTIDEAKTRSEFIKRQDNKFDIYICQVGCWCPWSPNPNDLTDQEYSETQLNTLMKQYKQNMDSKDELFEQRKAEMMSNTNSKSQVSNIADDLAGQSDPWIAAKQGKEEVKEEQTEVKEEQTEVKEEQTEVKEEEAVDIGRTPSD